MSAEPRPVPQRESKVYEKAIKNTTTDAAPTLEEGQLLNERCKISDPYDQVAEIDRILTENGLVWRTCTEGHMGQLRELHLQLFPVRYSDKFFKELIDGTYTTLSLFNGDNELVSIISAKLQSSKFDNSQIGYIATFGTRPDYRRRGISTAILREMEAVLIEDRIFIFELHVKSDNAGAIQLYQREGYDIIQELPNHYHFGGAFHDALLLRKDCTHLDPLALTDLPSAPEKLRIRRDETFGSTCIVSNVTGGVGRDAVDYPNTFSSAKRAASRFASVPDPGTPTEPQVTWKRAPASSLEIPWGQGVPSDAFHPHTERPKPKASRDDHTKPLVDDFTPQEAVLRKAAMEDKVYERMASPSSATDTGDLEAPKEPRPKPEAATHAQSNQSSGWFCSVL